MLDGRPEVSDRRPLVAVINDDPAFLELISWFLEEETRYSVVVWGEGVGSIPKLKQHRPELVILDIRLNDRESGQQILTEMRQDTDLLLTPVIVCTADSRFVRENKGLLDELGAIVLEKPFDLDALESTVSQALDVRYAGGEKIDLLME
jgi:CheY-like chemotaxis protein